MPAWAAAGSGSRGGSPNTEGINPQELASGDPWRGEVAPRPPYIGEPEASQGRIEHLERAVEDELAFDMHLELAPVLFEFPSI